MIHLHNLDVWFLSLTDYYTPGFYCSLTPVKGAHLVLLRDNAIKSLFPVYFFWSQWRTQRHPPGGKLKARPYICFSSVNLLQYHWLQWHNVFTSRESYIWWCKPFSIYSWKPGKFVLRKYSCEFALFYTLLQLSVSEHCLRQGTRLMGPLSALLRSFLCSLPNKYLQKCT